MAFAFALGNMTSIIQDNHSINKYFDARLAHMKQYLQYRIGDREVQRTALNYFGSCWRVSGRLYGEEQLLQELPRDIRNTIIQTVGRQVRQKFDIFRGHKDQLVGDVFLRMMPHHYSEGDVVFKAREVGQEMYLIESGSILLEAIVAATAQAWNKEVSAQVHVDQGASFGELALFQEICKYRYETATASNAVCVYVLTVDSLKELQTCHPAFCLKLKEMCELKAATIGVSNDVMESADDNAAIIGAASAHLDQVITKYKLELMAKNELKIYESPPIDKPSETAAAWNVINSKCSASKRTMSQRTASQHSNVIRGWLRVDSSVAGNGVGRWQQVIPVRAC